MYDHVHVYDYVVGYDLTSYAGLGIKVSDIAGYLDPTLSVNLVKGEVIKIDELFQEQYKKLRKVKPELFPMDESLLLEPPLDSFEPSEETELTKAIGCTLLYATGVDPDCFDAKKNSTSLNMEIAGESLIPFGTLYSPQPDEISDSLPSSLYCVFTNKLFETIFVPYLKRLKKLTVWDGDGEGYVSFPINLKRSLEVLLDAQAQTKPPNDSYGKIRGIEKLMATLLDKFLEERGYFSETGVNSTRKGILHKHGGMDEDAPYVTYDFGALDEDNQWEDPRHDPDKARKLENIKVLLVGEKHSGFDELRPIFGG